jgi:hypothetical protein
MNENDSAMNGTAINGVWLAVLLCAAAGVLVLAAAAYQQIETNATAHAAMCALKTKQARDVANAQKLLDDNPGPIVRAFGLRIPRSFLEANLADDKGTLVSLRPLDCST